MRQDCSCTCDPGRCPLCGAPNQCAMHESAGRAREAGGGAGLNCWCTAALLPASVLAQVPAAAQGRACICARCAQAGQAQGATLASR